LVIIEDIVSQHAEEAAFLWLLRAAAVKAPHYDLKDLADLEERIEAHLDGLRIAGEAAWTFCEDGLQYQEAGEVFAAACLALDADRDDWLGRAIETAGLEADTVKGLVSATGWVPRERLKGRVRDWLQSSEPLLRRVGVNACTVQRTDCGSYLVPLLEDTDPQVRAAALRNAGVMRRRDLRSAVTACLDDSDAECAYRAGYAATLLGQDAGLKVLQQVAGSDAPTAEASLQLMLRAMPHGAAVDWVRCLNQKPGAGRAVIQATGVIGDPASVPWLIEQMAEPPLARVAGEAFSMITGVDLAYDDLERDWPEGFEAGPTESAEDDDVALDADEDLAWPAPDLLAQWWVDHQADYRAGSRYLCGRPIDRDNCLAVLQQGMQRQRRAAALELALLSPERPLFNTAAPARRQRAQLGLG
jgi:uncharacterized protein (TIGR02270 family)